MESNQASGFTPKPVDQNNEMTQLDPDWQVSKTCIKERTAVLFNNELLADVHFKVGSRSTLRVPAHKLILATGSPVFYAMFYGGLAEDKKEVAIPDVEPQAFLNMLQYLYCDDVSLEADNVLPTLYSAKKYIMPYLVRVCVEYLEKNVDGSNACLLLNQSRIFEEPELMQRCLDVIDSQAEEALRSDSFIEIDYQTLEQILGRDTLRTNETIVFEAATRWAEAECTRQGRDVDSEQCREVLRDALYLLRLPTMSLNEFANGALQSGVLSKQEIIDIVSFFGADNKPKLPFPTTCRKGKNIKTCSRFHSTKYNWGFSVGRVNGITFSVDKAISVVGFGLYGSSKAAEYKVGIGLKHSDGTVLCEESHMMSYDSSNNTTHVMFDRPVRIKADTYYTARFVEGSNGPGYYGADGICYVKYDNINFTFAECMDLLNPTTVSKGQIPEILFYR